MFRRRALIGLFLWGCSPSQPALPPTDPAAPPPAAAVAPLRDLPVTFTVRQRSTSVIPGSSEQLSITIDDITRGQVIVSLLRAEQEAILGPVSLQQGESRSVEIDGSRYRITLDKLDNKLLGEDFATFVVAEAPAAAPRLTEAEKIERLIAAVAMLEGAVFIRNGDERSAAEAAEHLRQKYDVAGDRVRTAREFLREQLAHLHGGDPSAEPPGHQP